VDPLQGRKQTEVLKLGLVDRIGSLDDAINEAAVIAKVKHTKHKTTLNIKRLKMILVDLPLHNLKRAL
jgi:protease-4